MSVNADAQGRSAAARRPLGRRLLSRYTCAFPSFTPHKMLVNGTQLSRLAFFAALLAFAFGLACAGSSQVAV
jgi:hypothetical protein